MSTRAVALSTPLIAITDDDAEPLASDREALLQADLVEMTVQPQGWAKPVRIRTLTGTQRQVINAFAGVGDARDWRKFVVKTLCEGVVNPKFSPTSAGELFDFHNGELVEQLAMAIWELGRLDAAKLNAYLAAEKALRSAEKAAQEVAGEA
jgi:hypothetical protein